MKKHAIITTLLLLLLTSNIQAQFTSSAHFNVKSGTQLFIDGLTFVPSADMDLEGKAITVSDVPIPGKPVASIKRVYTLNQALTISGNVGIRYIDPDEMNGNTEDLLVLAFKEAAGANYITSPTSTVQPNLNHVLETVNKSFVNVTAVNANAVFPVKLVDFTAAKEENAVMLKWRTSEEENSHYFEIQRGNDGKNWEALGKVESAGASKNLLSYTFRDNDPLVGINLYRLKMVDHDKSFAYSQIRIVNFESQTAFKVFPNPAAGLIQIDTDDWLKVKTIEVINSLGRTVRTLDVAKTGSISKKEMNLQMLSAGTYIIKMLLTDGTFKTTQIVKN
ncbi:T9SS type A sorting domain-containing protein [Dyadobacter arcticus]|uniref:Secretion system C-terminal sorting domain-containing protein n=1 Tax=Dyadobacter arcticus TaxID=1078754 RepID=A0ABX0UG64_9BACT|nr:T9SS type A sorting domain-containing protein [Dyadobacter arcticus]NIJ51493.1 hypothetical protein [Dyadobacter arcticus]